MIHFYANLDRGTYVAPRVEVLAIIENDKPTVLSVYQGDEADQVEVSDDEMRYLEELALDAGPAQDRELSHQRQIWASQEADYLAWRKS